jgi:hypothetical protein
MKHWRAPALLGAILLLAMVAVVLLRWSALRDADASLRARGFSWESRETDWLEARWLGLQVELAEARLLPEPTVTLTGVRLDLERIYPEGEETLLLSGGMDKIMGIQPQVLAEQVDVYWGEVLLLEDLSGSIRPSLSLQGENQSLSRSHYTWSAQLPYLLETEFFRAPLSIHLSCLEDCEILIRSNEAVLDHPLLAAEALPPGELRFEGAFDVEALRLAGNLEFHGLTSGIILTWLLSPSDILLDFTAPDLDLAAIVDVFGELVPEAARARPEGRISLEGGVTKSGRWSLKATAADLGCKGLLTDTEGLRHGEVTWTARDEKGNPQSRSTGPMLKGFVSTADAGYLPNAIIAAEDSAFRYHPGYDLEAIRVAMARMQEEGLDAGLRGGSTLTQQLAKNLFLDGSERTLRRKLRELLYTLELERVLTKDQILQLYINVVEFGPGTWGASPAADAMFMKRPGSLTLKEAAYLASVLPAPASSWERYYLRGKSPGWRIGSILDNMVDGGALEHAQANRARMQELRFVPP